MAGRRRKRETTETLVVRHRKRKQALLSDLAKAATPAERVFAATEYLRGALQRVDRRRAGMDVDAVAQEAQEYLTELADRLFETAIEKGRSRR